MRKGLRHPGDAVGIFFRLQYMLSTPAAFMRDCISYQNTVALITVALSYIKQGWKMPGHLAAYPCRSIPALLGDVSPGSLPWSLLKLHPMVQGLYQPSLLFFAIICGRGVVLWIRNGSSIHPHECGLKLRRALDMTIMHGTACEMAGLPSHFHSPCTSR